MSRRFLAGAAIAGSLALAAAAPAHATLFERFNFTFEDSVEEDVCGIDARIDTVVRGVIVSRYLNDGLDQAFLGHATFKASDTFTNLANGESFRIEARVRDGDVTGRHVEGDIYEFTLTHTGIERVVDGDGDVFLRDSGMIRRTYLFDTLGDGMPGGELVDELGLSVRGPHPLFELDEDEFCAMVHELIG
jgi:hypothetical protein